MEVNTSKRRTLKRTMDGEAKEALDEEGEFTMGKDNVANRQKVRMPPPSSGQLKGFDFMLPTTTIVTTTDDLYTFDSCNSCTKEKLT